MRRYINKKNVQKQNYYKDRFYHAPLTPRLSMDESRFKDDYEALLACSIAPSAVWEELGHFKVEVASIDVVKVAAALKALGYNTWIELACCDYLEHKNGFEINYLLLDVSRARRVMLKTFIEKGQRIDSLCSVFKAANWSEREAYDMFGIIFDNHPSLRRLLMPDDWYGFPLLKSYPLEGDEFAKWYEIDRIFGKEYREVVGPENRDPGFIKFDDTNNFAQIYHEVPRGAPLRKDAYLQEYQEEGGAKFLKHPKRADKKILEERP